MNVGEDQMKNPKFAGSLDMEWPSAIKADPHKL